MAKADDGAELCCAGRSHARAVLGRRQTDADADRREPPIAAVTAVVVFGLIAVTPLCGFSPGSITTATFSMLAKLKCPWCNNVAAGALSMFAVFGASIFAAYRAASVSASDCNGYPLPFTA